MCVCYFMRQFRLNHNCNSFYVRLVLCVCFRTIFTSISVCRCQSTSIALAMLFPLQVRTTLCLVLFNENHKSIIISKASVYTANALYKSSAIPQWISNDTFNCERRQSQNTQRRFNTNMVSILLR